MSSRLHKEWLRTLIAYHEMKVAKHHYKATKYKNDLFEAQIKEIEI